MTAFPIEPKTVWVSHRLCPPTLTLPLKGGGNWGQIERKTALTSRQNRYALRNRLPGLGAQNGIVVVADGVRNDRVKKAGYAGGAGHGVGGGGEAVGHDGGGGEAGFVGGDGVMQTA